MVYCQHGKELIEEASNKIRGLVEIDQAERDRALEKALREKEEAAEKREKNLELWRANSP